MHNIFTSLQKQKVAMSQRVDRNNSIVHAHLFGLLSFHDISSHVPISHPLLTLSLITQKFTLSSEVPCWPMVDGDTREWRRPSVLGPGHRNAIRIVPLICVIKGFLCFLCKRLLAKMPPLKGFRQWQRCSKDALCATFVTKAPYPKTFTQCFKKV